MVNIIVLLTIIKEISQFIENYKETGNPVYLAKAEEALDKTYLKLVEKINL